MLFECDFADNSVQITDFCPQDVVFIGLWLLSYPPLHCYQVHLLYKAYLLIYLYLFVCLSLSLYNFHHYCFISSFKLQLCFFFSYYLLHLVINPESTYLVTFYLLCSKSINTVQTNRSKSTCYWNNILETFKTQYNFKQYREISVFLFIIFPLR